ncbi:MAG: ABC transporter permease, partial [Sphaerochaetaceae bacterium]
IDLSVVATANFTGVIAALILTKGPAAGMNPMLSIVLAIAATIVAALPVGLINGFLIAYIGVPPILATLGTQGLFLGIATVITKGLSVANFPKSFFIHR